MLFGSILYGSQVDFSYVAEAASSKSDKVIRSCLGEFDFKLAESFRVGAETLETIEDGELFQDIAVHILRYVTLQNDSDILPSLYSAYQQLNRYERSPHFTSERFGIAFSQHLKRLTPEDVMSFFETKEERVPFLFGFRFFAELYYESCASHKKLYLDDSHKKLIRVMNGNLGIYVLFTAIKHVDDAELLLKELKEQLTRDGVNEWDIVQALLTPGDRTILPVTYDNRHCDAYRNFLLAIENNTWPTNEEVRQVIVALHHAKQSATSYFREYSSMLCDFYHIVPMVVFYQRLKEFDCLQAVAIRKLIEAKHLPGMPSRPFQTIQSFCDYFSEDERKWLAKWDMTLCSFELQYFASEYDHGALRMRMIDLLCSVGDESACFDEFNLLEKPEYDDDGEQTNEVKGHLNLSDFIKDELYEKMPILQVRAAYRVVYRWLSAYDQNTLPEEWENSPHPDSVDPYRLEYFYDEVIGDIVRHPKYKDLEIAYKLTSNIYKRLSSEPIPLGSTLQFFKAYFSNDHDEQIQLYRNVIQSNSNYYNSAANNLAVAYIKCHQYELAQEVISNMDEGEFRSSRQEQLDSALSKIAKIERILAAPESELHLSNVSDLHLLYLTAVVHMAYTNKENVIRHKPEPFTSLLVPYYRTSHSIIRELMSAEVLRVKSGEVADFDPDKANQYTFTSLPLIPNIKGFIHIEFFLEVLRDEIKKRTIDPSAIKACENQLKLAWVLNHFYFTLSKGFDTDNVVLSLGDYEEIAPLVERFTPSQLHSIAWGAVNFVSGTMTTHGFGQKTACERMIPRLLKSLKEYSHTDFKSKTFGRPRIQTFHLEKILFWADGIDHETRFS